MKKYLLFVLLTLMSGVVRAQVSFGHAELMNDGWRFLRIDSSWNVRETADMKEVNYDDSRWNRVKLPHDWGVEQVMTADQGSCQGYLPGGIGWYRMDKTNRFAQLPAQSDAQYYLYFEGVYNHSEVYVNGQLAGRRPSGFASFLYNVTPFLHRDDQGRLAGNDVIAVRVDHSQAADSRWYTGSGINRHVWIVSAPAVHLAQWGMAYRLNRINQHKAVVEVDVETTDEQKVKSIKQPLSARVELWDADGRLVSSSDTKIGSQEKKTVMLTFKNPHRWTLQTPYLYTVKTFLSGSTADGVSIADTSIVRAGLRTLEFSPDRGFALNGQWMKVKGVCLHDDAGVLGTAVPKEVWRRRLMELKAIGVNAIRMSHNPHAPELYDLCDEIGLLVMDEASDEWEFPKRKWMKGWNQGRPGYQGTYTYFEEWIERDVADMVRRDRCHPSVFMWSIGNEVDYPNDPYTHQVLDGDGSFTQPAYGGYKPDQPNAERIGRIAERLSKVVKSIDTSRPTTGALAGVVMSNETIYPEVIDVVGYNYTESRYDEDHQKYPKRVIYGSENRHDLPAWKAVRDHQHIFGQFLWTGIDYLGESGTWPARGSSAGLLDLAGQRKPLGWYRASLWSEVPVCYIGTMRKGWNGRAQAPHPYANDTWNYRDGEKVRVMCYTNASSARLLLNGQPVGGEPIRDTATDILYWDIDYAEGSLRCEADNGATYEIKTTGVPVALRISTDSVMHVFVDVIDAEGRLVKDADHEVTLRVSGARLLGMENGDIMDSSVAGRRQLNRLRVHGGRLVAYVDMQGKKNVRISATAKYLDGVSVELIDRNN